MATVRLEIREKQRDAEAEPTTPENRVFETPRAINQGRHFICGKAGAHFVGTVMLARRLELQMLALPRRNAGFTAATTIHSQIEEIRPPSLCAVACEIFKFLEFSESPSNKRIQVF